MHTIDSLDITLRQMDLWYRSTLGSFLIEAERVELDRCLESYFGAHLLQLGGPSEKFLFEKSPILHRVRLSPEYASAFRGPCVQGLVNQLPFLPESIDVILLPHVLEFISNPEELLCQCNSVLAPEGHLLILGFNPYSLWGLAKYGLHHRQSLPWRGHFRSAITICHCLMKQGFEIEKESSLFFRPPLSNYRWLQKMFVLEVFGRLFWGKCGAIYIIIAKKRVISLLPPAKIAAAKTAQFPGYLEPSAKVR